MKKVKTKKKVIKKKVIKKNKKTVSKINKTAKKRKPKNPPIISDLEKFYKIINKLQTTLEQVKVLISEKESFTYDNILKDLESITIKKSKSLKNKKYIEYTLNIDSKSRNIPEFEDVENLPDEFFEDGQLFGI